MSVYYADDTFPFDKLTLSYPKQLQGGGTYITNLNINEREILIQFPKSSIKSKIITTKRTSYVDLIYNKSELDEWFKTLYKELIDLIFSKKEEWFSDSLQKEDIENAMIDIIKYNKNSKKIIFRSYLDNKCKLYDEEEEEVSLDVLDDNCFIIPLIKLDNIKFTSKSFELQTKINQIMLLNEKVNTENKCLIKSNNKNETINGNKNISDEPIISTNENATNVENVKDNDQFNSEKNSDEAYSDEDDSDEGDSYEGDSDSDDTTIQYINEFMNNLDNKSEIYKNEEAININEYIHNNENNENNKNMENNENNKNMENNENNKNMENNENNKYNKSNIINNESNYNNEKNILESLEDLEIDINLENKNNEYNDNIKLKDSKEIYLEMFKTAKNKAKEFKKKHLEKILEANKIKTNYLTDIIIESSEDEIN